MAWGLFALACVIVLIHLKTRGPSAKEQLDRTLDEGRKKAEEFEATYRAIHGHPPATNPFRQ